MASLNRRVWCLSRENVTRANHRGKILSERSKRRHHLKTGGAIRAVMEVRTKKLLANVGFGIWLFFMGVDYAVILPTAFLYVKSLGGNEFFYSLLLSAFSAASLLSGIFWGFWMDRLQKIKWITLCAMLCAITGGVLYTVGTSKYFLLGGRVLGGVGNGVVSVIFAHVSRTTATQDRTRIFSIFYSATTSGFLIGPGFNFVLRMCNFYIGPVKIDAYSSPGVFVAALLSILLIYMVLFLHDIPYADEDNNVEETEHPGQVAQASETPAYRTALWELLREESVVLLAVSFVFAFRQAGVETVTPPILEMMFKWGEVEISIYFICCGVTVTLGFLGLGYISKKFQDRTIVLSGLMLSCLTTAWFMVVFTNTYNPGRLPYFMIGFFLDIISGLLIGVVTASLFSKLTDPSIQGVAHGIRLAIISTGKIIGPVWTGATLYMLHVMVGVILTLVALVLTMWLLSFRRLKEPKGQEESQGENQVSVNADPDETTQLLSSSDA